MRNTASAQALWDPHLKSLSVSFGASERMSSVPHSKGICAGETMKLNAITIYQQKHQGLIPGGWDNLVAEVHVENISLCAYLK